MNRYRLFRLAAPGKLPERTVFVVSVAAMVAIFVANLYADPGLRVYVLYVLPLLAIGMHSSRRSLYWAGVAMAISLEVVTFILAGVAMTTALGNLLLEVLVALLCLSVADTARVSYLKVLDLSRTDDLTGLMNRRAFVRAVEQEIERQARYGGEFSIMMLDLDGFKALNDTYGHFAGDVALRHIAEALHANTRRADSIARIGGDEFMVLMPNTPRAACASLCQQLCSAIADGMQHSGFTVTASVGGVTFEQPPESIDMALRDTDAAMYRAKQNGGGCVVSA